MILLEEVSRAGSGGVVWGSCDTHSSGGRFAAVALEACCKEQKQC